MEIILASGSPRRRELLTLAGFDFVVEVSDVKESLIEGSPGELVEHLSGLKAGAVAGKRLESEVKAPGPSESQPEDKGKKKSRRKPDEECLIIGSDTIVVLDGRVLGKPVDGADAFRMLRELSGRTHQVYTGVTLIKLCEGKETSRESFWECTDVKMREISDEEIREYIASGEPMDKAGAYGIQGKAAVFISGIHGDYYNVVGLPVCRLTEVIKKIREVS